jgi:hypothetical protein
MSYGLVGLYGIYLVFVGINHNTKNLVGAIESDIKPFLVWILAIIILSALYSNDKLKPIMKPFIGLVVLVFVLKNYDKIVTQINSITGLKLPTTKA